MVEDRAELTLTGGRIVLRPAQHRLKHELLIGHIQLITLNKGSQLLCRKTHKLLSCQNLCIVILCEGIGHLKQLLARVGLRKTAHAETVVHIEILLHVIAARVPNAVQL